jgi:membrane-associated phospholipid phosphatase
MVIERSYGRTMHGGIKILTDFGDPAVLLPLSLVFFIWLLLTRRLATAIIWLLIVAGCNAVIAILKVYFLACPAGAALHSPSGHTCFSILVYGSLTIALALAVKRRWMRKSIIVLGTVFVAAIAVSRLLLGNHSPMEIVIGAAIGGVGLAVFTAVYRRGANRRGPVLQLALAVVVVAFIFHGEQVKAEAFLRYLGWEMGLRGEACGFR